MNKTKIDWCDMSWNPVTGCLHGCEYCYARKIATRFSNWGFGTEGRKIADSNKVVGGLLHTLDEPYDKQGKKEPYPFKFEPTFHRYRLDDPQKLKKPKRIFLCSMADLFGDWVPGEWINEVMMACNKAPQHTYIFLTKNPKRYGQTNMQHLFSNKNIWLGTTITHFGDSIRDKLLLAVTYPETNTFLSIEPLLKPWIGTIADIYPHNRIKWVIVGAQTGPGAIKPKAEWVQSIIDQCREANVPIWLKENLNWHETIQEFPGGGTCS